MKILYLWNKKKSVSNGLTMGCLVALSFYYWYPLTWMHRRYSFFQVIQSPWAHHDTPKPLAINLYYRRQSHRLAGSWRKITVEKVTSTTAGLIAKSVIFLRYLSVLLFPQKQLIYVRFGTLSFYYKGPQIKDSVLITKGYKDLTVLK